MKNIKFIGIVGLAVFVAAAVFTTVAFAEGEEDVSDDVGSIDVTADEGVTDVDTTTVESDMPEEDPLPDITITEEAEEVEGVAIEITGEEVAEITLDEEIVLEGEEDELGEVLEIVLEPEPVVVLDEGSGEPEGDDEKVTLCHFPPGNEDNPQTLHVAPASVDAHVGNHDGDYLGECRGDDDADEFQIIAHKVVCTDESYLPNWGSGGPDIDENTAADFVADSDGHCKLVPGWYFQWAPPTADNPGDDFYGGTGDPWISFGPTDGDGEASTFVDLEDGWDFVWMREILQHPFISFSYGPNGNTDADDYSAEMYCHTDVLHYDNYDRVDDVEDRGTYYCAAFNTPTDGPREHAPYCGDGHVNQEWELCDGGEDCTETCQNRGERVCTDLVLAKVIIDEVENEGLGDMTDELYLGSDSNVIPSNMWFPVYWNGSYITDPAMLGSYDDVAGLAVERREDGLHVLIHGSHPDHEGLEHIRGHVGFWSWDGSVEATGQIPDLADDKIEGPDDGVKEVKPGKDELWLNAGRSHFWLTVGPYDDGFTTTYSDAPVCDDDCLIEGYKYDADGAPLSGWEIGLEGHYYGPTFGDGDGDGDGDGLEIIDTDITDEEGYYCIPEFRSDDGSDYNVGEFLQDGWSPLDVLVDGTTTPYSVADASTTDSFFDVWVDVSLPEIGETLTVDFVNTTENGGDGDGDPTSGDGDGDVEESNIGPSGGCSNCAGGNGDGDGDVAGDSTDGEVLGAQTDILPLGAPNAGAGGLQTGAMEMLAGALALAGLLGLVFTPRLS